MMDENNNKITNEEVEKNKWRVLIYRALLLVILIVYIKFKVVQRIGFIPGILLIIVLVVVISNLLTKIFKLFLK